MAKSYFPLSHDLLRQALHLPDDAEIVAVEYVGRLSCAVWVEHKDIPEPRDNMHAKLLPTFKREGEQVTMINWSDEIPLATLDVMDHNARHTE